MLWTLISWGNKHFFPEGPSVIVVDSVTGDPAEPMVVDRKSGRPLLTPDFKVTAGPGANARTRAKYGIGEPTGRAS